MAYNIVLLGDAGMGKTTFSNRLTGSTNLTGIGAASVTKEVQLTTFSCGNRDFNVFDTPGLGAADLPLSQWMKIVKKGCICPIGNAQFPGRHVPPCSLAGTASNTHPAGLDDKKIDLVVMVFNVTERFRAAQCALICGMPLLLSTFSVERVVPVFTHCDDPRYLAGTGNFLQEWMQALQSLEELRQLLLEPIEFSNKRAPFSEEDVGKTVQITGNMWLTLPLPTPPTPPQVNVVNWGDANHRDLTGTIKSVEETFKGKVELEDGQEFENGGPEQWNSEDTRLLQDRLHQIVPERLGGFKCQLWMVSKLSSKCRLWSQLFRHMSATKYKLFEMNGLATKRLDEYCAKVTSQLSAVSEEDKKTLITWAETFSFRDEAGYADAKWIKCDKYICAAFVKTTSATACNVQVVVVAGNSDIFPLIASLLPTYILLNY